jgi:aryl-alcohol dehydrogenase-like predicted oxidoreductase
MHYRQLGPSDLLVSSVSFGCMSLGDRQTDNARLIHKALDRGINFFDTADLYDKGLNETMIGGILKGKRQQVILATKVGNQWRSDGSGWDWNPRKEYILKAVEESLTRLRTDRIDLYQLHGGTLEDPIDETIEAFELLQQQGKIRYYGLSSIRPNVIREYVSRSHIVSVMMQYSLLDRRPEESVLGLLWKEGIGVLARGGLAKGLLAGKPAVPYLDYSREQVAQAAEGIRGIADGHHSMAQKALSFVLADPAVTSAVTGIRTMEQLDEVTGTGEGEASDISEPDIKEITDMRKIIPINFYDQHR